MAFRFEEEKTSKLGKQVFQSMTGIDPGSVNITLKEHILSQYESVEDLKEKAKVAQDCEAQADLAMAYQYGAPEFNIKQDVDSAIAWYESSIHGGNCNPAAMLSLGTLYDVKGTVRHRRRAYEMYKQAANFGSLRAACNIAEMFRCGVKGVVKEDLQESFKWYRRVAGEEQFSDDEEDISHPASLFKGTMRSLDIDSKLQGLKRLHKYYMAGECPEGKPQPYKAVHYLKTAAELGDPEAQRLLGLSCLSGEGGNPKDLIKARRWLGKAAKSGDEEAKQALEKLEEQGIIDVYPAADETPSTSSFVQYCEILKIKLEQDKHPFVIDNPIVFQECTFTQHPQSPTAQHYLKAFSLVKKGLEQIQSNGFTDAEAIRSIALGILYENSITQSFNYIIGSPNFLVSLFTFISSLLKTNPTFFEGLFLIISLYPLEPKLNLESCKLDVKKTMSLKNLISLIKKAEPDKPPTEDPYNFEKDYSSWLHDLYYHLASLYIVSECFKDAAEACLEALKCCPKYFEAKLPLAYCFMNLAVKKKANENAPNLTEAFLETFEPPENQRVPKGEFLTWTEDQLQEKAKQLFMEYLQEAPECEKKYPHAHYHLAMLYMVEGNLKEAVKWKEKGEDAEEKRLPFLGPIDIGSKKMLAMLDVFPTSQMAKKKCSNKACPKKWSGKLKLKPCPCHKVSYCGSECQVADWKEHKKTCSHKKKRRAEK